MVTDRIEQMAKMSMEGVSLRKIGKTFGISQERVRQLLNRAGVDTSRPALPPDMVADMAVMARKGFMAKEIASLFGVTARTVYFYCRGHFDPAARAARLSQAKHGGRTYGRLTVLETRGVDFPCRCRCACGNVCTPILGNVVRGLTRSCGCLAEEYYRRRKTQGEAVEPGR